MVLVLVLAGAALLAALGGTLPPWSGGDTQESSALETTSLAQPADAAPVTIDHVHDGDTLFVVAASGERLKVRLIGVDAPEIGGTREGDAGEVGDTSECFGTEATDYLRSLLPVGTTAWVIDDEEALDRYGRSLLYLWTTDGTFVNHAIVAGGHGTALRAGANDAYWPELSGAEAEAQNAGLGLWGGC